MKTALLKVVCAIGMVLAVSTAAGACLSWAYQPEVPSKLLKS